MWHWINYSLSVWQWVLGLALLSRSIPGLQNALLDGCNVIPVVLTNNWKNSGPREFRGPRLEENHRFWRVWRHMSLDLIWQTANVRIWEQIALWGNTGSDARIQVTAGLTIPQTPQVTHWWIKKDLWLICFLWDSHVSQQEGERNIWIVDWGSKGWIVNSGGRAEFWARDQGRAVMLVARVKGLNCCE